MLATELAALRDQRVDAGNIIMRGEEIIADFEVCEGVLSRAAAAVMPRRLEGVAVCALNVVHQKSSFLFEAHVGRISIMKPRANGEVT